MTLTPKYVFEATIYCDGPDMTREKRKALLSLLDIDLTATTWERDGMNFVKMVPCATGDLGAAEDEFIQALMTCAQAHTTEGELTTLKVTFNSSTISIISTPLVT